MRRLDDKIQTPARWAVVAAILFALCGIGCAGNYATSTLFTGFIGTYLGSSTTTTTTGGGSSFFSTGGREERDPCEETNPRKFIRVSMRNTSPDYVHYFFVAIAFVNGDVYPDGAVCADDISLYTQNGYVEIPEDADAEFGNICIQGPALYYFHEAGQFQQGGGASGAQLASAIGPAQGTSPTYDNFFIAGGAQIPVPNQILFHNPGTGEGAALKVSRGANSPCDTIFVAGVDSDCAQDAFYYVDEFDQMAGSVALGSGAGRRTASEVQGTGCECVGTQTPLPGVGAIRHDRGNRPLQRVRSRRLDRVRFRAGRHHAPLSPVALARHRRQRRGNPHLRPAVRSAVTAAGFNGSYVDTSKPRRCDPS